MPSPLPFDPTQTIADAGTSEALTQASITSNETPAQEVIPGPIETAGAVSEAQDQATITTDESASTVVTNDIAANADTTVQ